MRMHKNRFWLAFLIAIALVVAWYCGVALYKLYRYSKLTAQVSADSIQWGVKSLSDEQYIVKANYTFNVEGKEYRGETNFKDEVFMNAWAVEQTLPKYAQKVWKVWYQPGNFHHSTLQKKFPAKECYSAGAMLLLLLYFIWLGFYVTRYQV